MVLVQILVYSAAMLVALFYFGYGLTRVILPASFAAWRWFLVPFTGLALVIVWDYAALFFGFNLTIASWALAAVVAPLNAYGLMQEGREIRRAGLAPFTRAHWLVLAIAVLAFAAAVAPLVRYGYITIIGENWDYENSLPLADYLRTYTMQTLAQAPPNPLQADLLGPHILPLPWAFSYLLATFNVFLNQQALDLFAIFFGMLHGMSTIAAFMLCRVGLKMSTRSALLATLLYSLNGLLLWFTYWNFGPHNTALAILPLALAAGIVALREQSIRAILFAALLLAALNIAFNPSFALVLLLLGAVGLYYLLALDEPNPLNGTRINADERGFSKARSFICVYPRLSVSKFMQESWNPRIQVLAIGAALFALIALFSFPLLFHIRDLFREYYGSGSLHVGLRDFVPVSDGYGLSLYTIDRVVGQSIPTRWLYDLVQRVWDMASLPVLVFVVLVSAWGLIQIARNQSAPPLTRGERATWFLVIGGLAAYLAILRLPFLHAYPYGFLKALSLVSLPLLALLAQGFFSLPKQARVIVWAGRIGIALVLGLVLLTFGISFEQYFKPAPRFFDADALRVRDLETIIPPNASVLLTERPEAQGIAMGLAAYALLQRPLYGNVTTGYSNLKNVSPGQVYDYALLTRGEDAGMRGYDDSPLWSNQTLALYQRAPGVLYQQTFDAAATAPQSLTFTLAETQIISGTQTVSALPAMRGVNIAIASFITQTVTLTLGAQTDTIHLQPGLVLYPTFATLPATLVLTPTVAPALLQAAQVTEPHQLPKTNLSLFVPYIQLRDAVSNQTAQNTPSAVLVQCTNVTASALDARCFVANPNGVNLTWRWIVRGTLQASHEDQVFAQVETAGTPRASIDLSADPMGFVSFRFDDARLLSFQTGKLPDGNFRGALEILSDHILRARIDLYTFAITRNGDSLTRDSHVSPLAIIKP